MKITNRKVLIAAVGSAGVLAMLITMALMAASGDDSETPAVAEEPRAVTRTPLSAERLTAPGKVEESVQVAKMERAQAELLEKVERLESMLAGAEGGRLSRDVDDLEGNLDEGGVEESPEAREERAMAAISAQIDLLETTLDTELEDEEWADAAVTALRDAFEGEIADGIQLLEADCRSSMCRLTLAFDAGLAEEGFRKLQSIAPWAGETFFQVNDVTSGEAVVYIAREDHRLPRAGE